MSLVHYSGRQKIYPQRQTFFYELFIVACQKANVFCWIAESVFDIAGEIFFKLFVSKYLKKILNSFLAIGKGGSWNDKINAVTTIFKR